MVNPGLSTLCRNRLTVTTSGTSAKSSLLRQHVCNLPLSYSSSASFLQSPSKTLSQSPYKALTFITPLRTKNNCNPHGFR